MLVRVNLRHGKNIRKNQIPQSSFSWDERFDELGVFGIKICTKNRCRSIELRLFLAATIQNGYNRTKFVQTEGCENICKKCKGLQL